MKQSRNGYSDKRMYGDISPPKGAHRILLIDITELGVVMNIVCIFFTIEVNADLLDFRFVDELLKSFSNIICQDMFILDDKTSFGIFFRCTCMNRCLTKPHSHRRTRTDTHR